MPLVMAPTPEEIYERLAPALGAHDREAVLERIREAIVCPVCGGVLTSFCPRCRGRSGGSKVSPKKLRALKRSAKKPRPGARGPRQAGGAGEIAADSQ